MSRQEIIDLIHNEYDPAPAHYKMGDNWDDGSGRIADAVMARIEALEALVSDFQDVLDRGAARIEALEAALREVIVTMKHAHVFITSREKMHPTGIELYDELLTKIAALAPEPK